MTSFTFRSAAGHLITVKAEDERTAREKAMIELHGTPTPFGLGRKLESQTDVTRGYACYPIEWTGFGLDLVKGKGAM